MGNTSATWRRLPAFSSALFAATVSEKGSRTTLARRTGVIHSFISARTPTIDRTRTSSAPLARPGSFGSRPYSGTVSARRPLCPVAAFCSVS